MNESGWEARDGRQTDKSKRGQTHIPLQASLQDVEPFLEDTAGPNLTKTSTLMLQPYSVGPTSVQHEGTLSAEDTKFGCNFGTLEPQDN